MFRRVLALLGSFAVLVTLALPASAGTTTTFTLSAGSLTISEPASTVNLGTVATGAPTITALLGTVSVSDGRGTTLGSWTASVSSTDFTTGGATSNETIAKASLDYWSGASTSNSGVGVFTPGQLLSANKQTLGTSRTAFSATALVGNNTQAWNPTVVVNVPAAAVAGLYTGTITHSVA